MTDPGEISVTAPAAPALQFDRLESTADTASGATASNVDGILCSACGLAMFDEYYSIRGKPICANCRASVEATRATSRTPRAFGKALVFGLGGALAGAAVYFAVFALLDAQIGIVAILTGWLVGRAIQKALPGGGSRRYQVLAAVLTYFAVGMAYTAVGLQESWKGGSDLPGIGTLIAFAVAVPVRVVFGSGDILGGIIIAIGVYQAWRMSGAPTLAITGPFRVGRSAVTAGGS